MHRAKGFLVIENSTDLASMHLSANDGQKVWESEFASGRHHNVELFRQLEAALQAADEADLELELESVLVGTGPGSYGGVRAALAAGLGVAMSRGGRLYGMGSFSGEAVDFVVGDARRGRYFSLALEQGRQAGEACLMDRAAFEVFLEQHPASTLLRSDEAERYPEVLQEKVRGLRQARPAAGGLAKAWLQMSGEQRAGCVNPEPLYLRPPHITPAKGGHPLLREK